MREFGSEFEWDESGTFAITAHTVPHPLHHSAQGLFRSGRDALKALAASLVGSHERVLLPALCCESMVSPFSMHGYRVDFYRLTENYTADFEDVISRLTPNTVLLYLPYFGIPCFSEEQLSRLREQEPTVILLEDRTHDLLCRRESGEELADWTVASIRKWFAIGDGGLLRGRGAIQQPTETDPVFSSLRKQAMEQKRLYLACGDASLKQAFRRTLGEAAARLDESGESFAMTQESRARLASLDYDAMLRVRQQNVRTLTEALQPCVERGLLAMIGRAPENSTLYVPVLVSKRDAVQQALAQEGIYCPVIWPVPKEAEGICPVSDATAARMLALPCDQRYDREDMRHIASRLTYVLNEMDSDKRGN